MVVVSDWRRGKKCLVKLSEHASDDEITDSSCGGYTGLGMESDSRRERVCVEDYE